MRAFVLRLWVTHDADCHENHGLELRGVVEAVASKERVPFRNESELLAALRAGLREPTGDLKRLGAR